MAQLVQVDHKVL
jgi:hypothetical protein